MVRKINILMVLSIILLCISSVYSAPYIIVNDLANFEVKYERDINNNLIFRFVDIGTNNTNYPTITSGSLGGWININLVESYTGLAVTNNENVTINFNDLPLTLEYVINNMNNSNFLPNNLSPNYYNLNIEGFGEASPEQQYRLDSTPFTFIPTPVQQYTEGGQDLNPNDVIGATEVRFATNFYAVKNYNTRNIILEMGAFGTVTAPVTLRIYSGTDEPTTLIGTSNPIDLDLLHDDDGVYYTNFEFNNSVNLLEYNNYWLVIDNINYDVGNYVNWRYGLTPNSWEYVKYYDGVSWNIFSTQASANYMIFEFNEILGCMNSSSINYNPNATQDDFSCFLYYVPNLENNEIEVPLNNNTHIGQSFVGNNETITNGSFYMKNKFGVTPLYDINVAVYTPVLDSMGNYYCEWTSPISQVTPVSTGFIDRNLILNDVSLVNFELTPYLLEQDRPYCMVFITKSNDELNPNDVIMFKELLNPNPTHNVDFLSGNQVYSFIQDLTSDLAGYVYTTSQITLIPVIPEFISSPDTINYDDVTRDVDLTYSVFSSDNSNIKVIENLLLSPTEIGQESIIISTRILNNLSSNDEILAHYKILNSGTYQFEVIILNQLDNNYNYTSYTKTLDFTQTIISVPEKSKFSIGAFMVDIGNGISGFLGGITETLASYLLIIGTIGAVIYMFYLVAKMIQDSLNLRKK
jgi:hypothetical protein